MKFVCDKCHTKYSIADDKVRQKVLKIRCKTCANVITVRESASEAAEATAEFDESSTRIDQGPSMMPPPVASTFAKPSAPGGARAARQAEPADWHLAIEGKQEGPFGKSEIVRRLLSVGADEDAHVWKEDFDGWLAPEQVPELKAALAAERARRAQASKSITSGAKPGGPPAHPPAPSAPARPAKPTLPPTPAAVPLGRITTKAAPVAAAAAAHAPAGVAAKPFAHAPVPAAAAAHAPAGAAAKASAHAPVPAAAAAPRTTGPKLPTVPGPDGGHATAPRTTGPKLPAVTAAATGGHPPAHAAGPPPGTPRPVTGSHSLRAGTPAGGNGFAVSGAAHHATPAPHPAAASGGVAQGALDFDIAEPSKLVRMGAGDASSLDIARALPGFPSTGAMAVGAGAAVMLPEPPAPAADKAGARGLKLAVALLAVVVVICLVFIMYLNSQRGDAARSVPATPKPPLAPALSPEDLGAAAAERLAQGGAAAPIAAGAPGRPGTAAVVGTGARRALSHPSAPSAPRPSPPALRPVAAAAPAVKPSAEQEALARRFADDRHTTVPSAGTVHAGPVSQDAVVKVFKANQGMVKSCYERALMRDRTLKGRVDVSVTIGLSGKVKHVDIKAATEMRVLEPCVREAVSRWAFPASGEEYEMSFPYLFSGSE